MSLSTSIRPLIPLVIGLVVGGVGVSLFRESLPGAEGSPEVRANKLEHELKHARNQLAALEAGGAKGRPGRTLSDGLRSLAEDFREGRPVTPDDVFRRAQPLLRDLAPLFERMRIRDGERQIDSLTGELTRKYNLTPAQQESLKQWFTKKTEEDAKRWTEMVGNGNTSLEDLSRESRNARRDEGLDAFMEKTLTGDKLAAFKTERLAERSQRVQQEADMRVERVDSIVKLDDAQRDKVFGIMARGSSDYDPSMKLEGADGEIGATAGGNREQATLAVLRPDQRAAYEAERQRRRAEAEKDAAAIGLTLPEKWDLLDQ
jgi:hypothetical protein